MIGYIDFDGSVATRDGAFVDVGVYAHDDATGEATPVFSTNVKIEGSFQAFRVADEILNENGYRRNKEWSNESSVSYANVFPAYVED